MYIVGKTKQGEKKAANQKISMSIAAVSLKGCLKIW